MNKKILLGLLMGALITNACYLLGYFAFYSNDVTQITNEIESNNYISYYMENENGEYTYISNQAFPTSGYTLNEEKSYCVNESDLEWDGTNINVTTSGSDSCYIYFDEKLLFETGTLPYQILVDAGLRESETVLSVNESAAYIESKSTEDVPDFDTVATDDEGMFATEDDYGTSYYFRGDVDDNWVYWAGFYWRIVRIDGQGNVKLIYSGTDASLTTDDLIDTSEAFNSIYNSPEYVGYMYTLGELHGTSTDSTIKIAVDTWYTNNLVDYESDIATDGIFCSDRNSYTSSSISSTAQNTTITTSNQYFGTLRRVDSAKSPSLLCDNELDQLTWDTSNEGNAVLDNPIALITLDEASFAGGECYSSEGGSSNNSSYYLYTGSYYWTLSPYNFISSYSTVGGINSSGNLRGYYVNGTSGGVRITVYLDSDTLATGDGSELNPYTIS